MGKNEAKLPNLETISIRTLHPHVLCIRLVATLGEGGGGGGGKCPPPPPPLNETLNRYYYNVLSKGDHGSLG